MGGQHRRQRWQFCISRQRNTHCDIRTSTVIEHENFISFDISELELNDAVTIVINKFIAFIVCTSIVSTLVGLF